jgi:ParB-like chromosome segregation protein Spo0J
MTKSWRDVLPVHPETSKLPRLSPDELAELAADIKEHGLRRKIDLYEDASGTVWVVDGTNRLDALESSGVKVITPNGQLAHAYCGQTHRMHESQVPAWVISTNVRRRHLSQAQKREALVQLRKLDPGKSNRGIAKEIGFDDKTVGAVRAKLDATAEIPQLDTATGADGKQRAVKKPKPEPEEINPPEASDVALRKRDHQSGKRRTQSEIKLDLLEHAATALSATCGALDVVAIPPLSAKFGAELLEEI